MSFAKFAAWVLELENAFAALPKAERTADLRREYCMACLVQLEHALDIEAGASESPRFTEQLYEALWITQCGNRAELFALKNDREHRSRYDPAATRIRDRAAALLEVGCTHHSKNQDVWAKSIANALSRSGFTPPGRSRTYSAAAVKKWRTNATKGLGSWCECRYDWEIRDLQRDDVDMEKELADLCDLARRLVGDNRPPNKVEAERFNKVMSTDIGLGIEAWEKVQGR